MKMKKFDIKREFIKLNKIDYNEEFFFLNKIDYNEEFFFLNKNIMKDTTKPYNLFLDDVRSPCTAFHYMPDTCYLTEDWVVVRSHNDFVDHVTQHGVPKLVSFDHDLGDEHYGHATAQSIDQFTYDGFTEKTGWHSARWLIEHCIELEARVPDVMIHSMNVAGSANIKSLFDTYNKYFLDQKDK